MTVSALLDWRKAGKLAGVIWIGATLVAAWLQPESHLLRDPVSYLGARGLPYAWLFNAGLALSGLLVLRFAVGLHRALAPRAYGWWAPALLGIFGVVGFWGTALFPCEASCAPGGLAAQFHYVVTVSAAASVLWALISLAGRLDATSGWGRQARATRWAAHLCVGCLVLFDLAGHGFFGEPGDERGLVQLAFFGVVFGWMGWMSGGKEREKGEGGETKDE